MVELGQFALFLGLFLSGYAVVVDPLGAFRKDSGLIKSGRNATIGCLLCLSTAMGVLWYLLMTSDFSVSYVVKHTSKALPMAYKFSALWAGPSGSLLLWLWLQVGFVIIVFCHGKKENEGFMASARTLANLVSVFFLILIIKDQNPFLLSQVVRSDGAGLNPLLQHPAMVLHPPTLFIGYAAYVIPFAWAIASLKYKGTADEMPMLKEARTWSLWAWLFLTIGIVLGAWWAYEELGWGGYWAWDAVENSSLMPWLIATALLHCFRTYKDRSPIATWTVILSLVTFSFCVFSTYLTKSGLIASVHAFPDPGLSILFLVLLIHIWIISAVLMIMKFLRTKNDPHPSLKNTLQFIFINNWLLVILTFVILIGTLFPFLSGLFTEQKISLKPEYFDKITTPFGLALLLLITVCPHLIRAKIKKNWRIVGVIVIAVAAVVAWIITKAYAIPCFIICGFGLVNLTVDVIGYEMSFAKRTATSPNATRNLQWYGARIVHVGVVLTFMGLAGAGGYSVEKFAVLVPGDSAEIGDFKLQYKEMIAEHGPNFTAVAAEIEVYRDDKMLTTLKPSKAFYHSGWEPVSEVSIRRTLGSDLYTAVTELDKSNKMIKLRMLIKPLINWVWIGSILSMLGTMVVLASLYQKKVLSN